MENEECVEQNVNEGHLQKTKTVSKAVCLVYAVGCIFVFNTLAVPMFTPYRNPGVRCMDTNAWTPDKYEECPFVKTMNWKKGNDHYLIGINITFNSNNLRCKVDVLSSNEKLHTTMCYTHNTTHCLLCFSEPDRIFTLGLNIYVYLRCDGNKMNWPFKIVDQGDGASPFFYIRDNIYFNFDSMQDNVQTIFSIERFKNSKYLFRMSPHPARYTVFDY